MDLKQRIARQFSRAAGKYDAAALVQADIAFDALQLVNAQHQCALDIGCGTGRVTQVLAEQTKQLFALDLAEGMVKYARSQTDKPIYWLSGDAEILPFQDESFDLVFSSMAMQWCSKLDDAMGEIFRVMQPGGKGVLAIMSNGSFSELNHSWQLLDVNSHTNQFGSEGDMAVAASKAGFEVRSHNKLYTTWHSDVRQLLGSIKGIGANVVTNTNGQQMLKRSALQELQRVYQDLYAEDCKLPLTYSVCFLQLQKPVV